MSHISNMTERRKQEDRRREAEAKLIEAATTLIAERGYDQFSLGDVGQMAKVSRGLPTHYFGSKDNLLSIVATGIVSHFIERLDARPTGGSGIEPIAATLRLIAERTLTGQLPSRALPVIIGAALVNPELAASLKKLNDAGIAWVENILRQGIAAKTIRADIDPYAEAAAITAMHRGCTTYFMLDSTFPMEGVIERFIVELDRRLTIDHKTSTAGRKRARQSV